MNKNKNYSFAFIKFFISVFLSVVLLESAGVDATKANILAFEKFSFSVLILMDCALYVFDKIVECIKDMMSQNRETDLNKNNQHLPPC